MKILEVTDLRVSFPVTGGVFARKVAEVKAPLAVFKNGVQTVTRPRAELHRP